MLAFTFVRSRSASARLHLTRTNFALDNSVLFPKSLQSKQLVHRFATGKVTEQQSQPQSQWEWVTVYEGNFSSTLKRLKRISATTCVLSLVGMPVLLANSTESVPLVGQLAITGTAIAAACGSTALLHWCTKPYVHKFQVMVSTASKSPGDVANDIPDVLAADPELCRVEIIDIISRSKAIQFGPSTIKPQPNAWQPFVNFSATDEDLLLYVEPLEFEHEQLLQKILGLKTDIDEMPK